MVSSHIEQLLQFLAQAPSLVYLVAFGASLVEGAAFVGLVFPSETTLLVAGATTIHPNIDLSILIPLTTFGAIAGDSLGYAIGKKLGPRLKTSGLGRRVKPHQWSRAEELIHRRGWSAIMLGRFVSILRSLVPAVAGALHLKYSPFLFGNVLGAIIWTPLVLVAGHFAAHNLRGAEKIVTRSGWTLLGFFLLISVVVILRLRRDAARDRVGDQTSRSSEH